MTDTAADPYRCPTPCDPDCVINGWGCHEAHALPKRREHDLDACEARTAVANLKWLLDTGWLTQLGACVIPVGHPPMYFAALRVEGRRVEVTFTGASVPEAVGKVATWAREGAAWRSRSGGG